MEWPKWGTTQNFCLTFTDELVKQIFIKKTDEVSQLKTKIISIFTMLHLKKKLKENTRRYLYFTPVYQNLDMNCSSWDIESDRLKLPNNLKIKILKKWKKAAGEIILYMCTNHLMYSFYDTDWDRQNFLSFWVIFYPFTQLTIRTIKILKNWKKHLDILFVYTSVA